DYAKDIAHTEAQKDLRKCHIKLLEEGHKYFTAEHMTRNIALPLLSASLGFPYDVAAKTAVDAILDFAKNNEHKNKYKWVSLFVDNNLTKFLDAVKQDIVDKNLEMEMISDDEVMIYDINQPHR